MSNDTIERGVEVFSVAKAGVILSVGGTALQSDSAITALYNEPNNRGLYSRYEQAQVHAFEDKLSAGF